MAGAGFLFTPHELNDDTAKCFYCGIELSGWDPDDNPVYVPFALSIILVLTVPERNTGGGSRNVARNVPSSPQELRNFLIRRSPSAKLHLKHPYKHRNPPGLVPPKPLKQNPILTIKRATWGGVLVLGPPRQRRLLLEIPLLPDPELRLRLSRRTSPVEATQPSSRSRKRRVRNGKQRKKHRLSRRRMNPKRL